MEGHPRLPARPADTARDSIDDGVLDRAASAPLATPPPPSMAARSELETEAVTPTQGGDPRGGSGLVSDAAMPYRPRDAQRRRARPHALRASLIARGPRVSSRRSTVRWARATRSRSARVTPERPPVPNEVRRVVIVGAGTMGQQVGFQCAGHGVDIVLYDVDPAAHESARGRIAAYAHGLVADGVITAKLRDEAMTRITMTTDPAAAATDADLLSEAVPEDPKLKGRVLAQFDALCPPRTIFATNTSTLLPSQFAPPAGGRIASSRCTFTSRCGSPTWPT
jgi:hypothetical protein